MKKMKLGLSSNSTWRNMAYVKWINEAFEFLGFFKTFQSSVAFHIETRHLFRSAKQMTGFYMKCNTALK